MAPLHLSLASRLWPGPPSAISRRGFLRGTVALAAASLVTTTRYHAARAQVRFIGYPFTLGVASGCPQPEQVVLWTRLAPDPLNGGGMAPERVEVLWEIAHDERFQSIVQQGSVWTAQELGHSVHVEVSGLEPARWYWYRFRVGDEVSPIGRTRTAPAPHMTVERLRVALASCQHYEQGYFSAYRHMAEDEVDLVIFVGDYIYEGSWGDQLVRRHVGPETYTLLDYRNRYAQYRTDPDLQRMHALVPWLVTWDDHEVDNDYANDQSEHLDPQFLVRRAAAYQAYYEHMPLRPSARPRGPYLRLYDRYAFGQLLQVHLLDDRQYRSPQVCPRPGMGGGTVVQAGRCPDLRDPTRTLLGADQEQWLLDGLRASPAGWNVLAQQTLMAQVDSEPGPEQTFWTDGWDGYAAARTRVLGFLAQQRAANPLVLGGDVHSYWVCDLKPDFNDPRAPVVATEVCTTSITSQGVSQARVDALRAENPHVKFASSEKRGYVRLDFAPGRCEVHLRALDSEKTRASALATLASFVVENGRPGAISV